MCSRRRTGWSGSSSVAERRGGTHRSNVERAWLGHRVEAMSEKKSWADLTAAQRAAIIAAGTVELVITAVAVRDLVRRPSQAVRGPKLLWAATFVVQPFGPLGYLTLGRRSR